MLPASLIQTLVRFWYHLRGPRLAVYAVLGTEYAVPRL